MKIGVIGPGAVGSYYAALLTRNGHSARLLLRSDYEAVREKGLQILSPRGDFHLRPEAFRTPDQVGICDLVLIGLKTTANETLPRLLPPLVGEDTVVLTLQNGLGNEETLAKLIPASQIMGGLCFVCLNRIAPGVIRHIDHGLVVLGEFAGGPRVRTHALAAEFNAAGVQCRVSENLAQAHWEKLVWNVPFNGLGVAGVAGHESVARGELSTHRGPVLTTDMLLGDERWSCLVKELMQEVIRAAQRLGYGVRDEFADELIQRTRSMGAYKASTLIDYERGQPLEVESLFLEPLRQARAAGLDLPRLSALCRILAALTAGPPNANP